VGYRIYSHKITRLQALSQNWEKVAISFVLSVRLADRMEKLGSLLTVPMKFYI
jgi:hypothetical protein